MKTSLYLFSILLAGATYLSSCQKEPLMEGKESPEQNGLKITNQCDYIYAATYSSFRVRTSDGEYIDQYTYPNGDISAIAYKLSTHETMLMQVNNGTGLYKDVSGSLQFVCDLDYDYQTLGYIDEIEFNPVTGDLYAFTGPKILRVTDLSTGSTTVVNSTAIPNANKYNSSITFNSSGNMYVTVCETYVIKTYYVGTNGYFTCVGTYNRPSAEWFVTTNQFASAVHPLNSTGKLYISINKKLYYFVGTTRYYVGENSFNEGMDFTVKRMTCID